MRLRNEKGLTWGKMMLATGLARWSLWQWADKKDPVEVLRMSMGTHMALLDGLGVDMLAWHRENYPTNKKR